MPFRMRPPNANWAVRAALPATVLALALTLTVPLTTHPTGRRAQARPLTGTRGPETTDTRGGKPSPTPSPAERESPLERGAVRPQASSGPAERPARHLLVRAEPGMVARTNPWAGARAIGEIATVSRYYREPLVLWVEEVSRSGAWGRVELPYVWPRREGWIALDGLRRLATRIEVRVDLSDRLVRVFRGGELLFGLPGAIGAPVSPTPPGDYVVTDRVPFSAGSSLGTFAFGISGIQPNLPPGWSGGDQLAIHGTGQPSSIGQAASAGCIRVSEAGLTRLLPLLRQGTPVRIAL